MIINSQEIEARAVEQVADLMCIAARTAPKGRGVDNLVTLVVKAETKDKLADEMRKIASQPGAAFFSRDASCVDKAPLVVLFGQKVKLLGTAACGYCGFADCGECSANKGLCAISIGDLGIAMGSAVSTAALHHVDNRIMFSIGRAALNLKLLGDEVVIAYGIPLSVTGKSPFYDRG
jgi:uncharacterized ferredoxin-like protein